MIVLMKFFAIFAIYLVSSDGNETIRRAALCKNIAQNK